MIPNIVRSVLFAGIATAALLGTFAVSSGCSSWTDSPGYVLADAGLKLPDVLADPVNFKRDIRPFMNRTNVDKTGHGCRVCHYGFFNPGPVEDAGVGAFWGAKAFESTGLDLSSLGALRQGGFHTRDNIIVPYDCPAPGEQPKSAIIQKLRGTFYLGTQMPKDGPPFWNEQQIQLFQRWICEGAKGDDNE